MSNVDVCAFAHEGKFREVYDRIEAQPDLVTKKDQCGWTPLMIASSAGRTEIVAILIGLNANIDACNFNGQTCLHYAASRYRFEIAEKLIENGANVNVKDKTSNATPLHRAASRGHAKMVKLLINAGCDIQAQDLEGNTALHMACEEERSEIAVILAENGADMTLKNKQKKTASELANKGLGRQLVRLSGMGNE